ncbi:NEW3 domain-containing protein [Infirmifilum sp. NZ]|uniref:NEW3 domain-containing protein n=1 Tax=Infirmifilum sp. NZ TaxID=2926850 RepID=UPI0027A82093|nr:NEW3 domain-containing protein [Infirmifilum sp. NZ]UNQ73574.1 NEW3 domain-containing protein [Infirmifilum sp. NZ]
MKAKLLTALLVIALVSTLSLYLSAPYNPQGSASRPEVSAGVSGYVYDSEGNPLPGVAVTVYNSNGGVEGTTTTSSSGFFSIALMPGTYTLKLSKPGYVDKSQTFTISTSSTTPGYVYLGTITMSRAVVVSVPVQSIKLPVLSTASYQVQVSNQGSQPVSVAILKALSCPLDLKLTSGSSEVQSLMLDPSQTVTLNLAVTSYYTSGAVCNATLTFQTPYYNITRTLTVTIYPVDLGLVTTQASSIKVSPGSVVSIPLQVLNKLSTDFTAEISVDLPQGWSGKVLSSQGVEIQALTLTQGSSASLTLTLEVPKSATAGSYAVTVRLTGKSPYFEYALPLTIAVSAGAPKLRIEAQSPHVDTYAGKSGKFPITLYNLGDSDALVNFTVEGLPSGYSWSMQDSQGNTVSQVYIKAGSSIQLALVVGAPVVAEPTNVQFTLVASTAQSSDSVNLSLGVLGQYKLAFVTQSFYLETVPGADASFQVQVQNSGMSTVTNVALKVLNAPSGFTVSVTPTSVAQLKPGDTATFILSISTDSTINTGDYYVTFAVTGDQVDAMQRDLHVYVKPSGTPAYLIGALVLVLVVALILAYRRFGRR